jgi:thioredoxin-like negative regulator of GroEL
MERLVIAILLVGVAVAIATVMQRRRPDAPMQGSPVASLPQQLDRDDFDQAASPWLVVVFTSETCDACLDVVAAARQLEQPDVAVQVLTWQNHKQTHERYKIDSVPATVIAGRDGAVGAGFIGRVPASELAEALEGLQQR